MKNRPPRFYSIPFSFRCKKEGDVYMTFAFLFSTNKETAVDRLKRELKSHNREFIELVDPVKRLDPNNWDNFIRETWPHFKHRLPEQKWLFGVDERFKAHILPGIQLRRSPPLARRGQTLRRG